MKQQSATSTPSPEHFKIEAGEYAVRFVESGMAVGLGTGSTAIHAVRRIGRPHEVVTTVLYLASDHSSFTTGSVIELSGGIR